MPRSVLDQLGDQPVPQQPAGFRRRLHDRINSRLAGLHLLEMAVCLLPYAFTYFVETLIGAVAFSFTGRYPEKGENDAERNDTNG